MTIWPSKSRITPGIEQLTGTKLESPSPRTNPKVINQNNLRNEFFKKVHESPYKANTQPTELNRSIVEAIGSLSKSTGSMGVWNRAVTASNLVEPMLNEVHDINLLKDQLGIHITDNKSMWIGLKPNNIQAEEYSLAAALIHHATARDKEIRSNAGELNSKINSVQQNLDVVLEKLKNSPTSTDARTEKIIEIIHSLLPKVFMVAQVISKSECGVWNQKSLSKKKNNSINLSEYPVLLIEQGGRYEAVTAANDAIAMAVQDPTIEAELQKSLQFKHEQANCAAIKIIEAANKKYESSSKNIPLKKRTALLPAETTIAELLEINVEKVNNFAPKDLNFICGVLRHATGVYKREELKGVGSKFVLNDAELHTTEAQFILSELMVYDKTKREQSRMHVTNPPLGRTRDARTQFVINKINEIYNTNLAIVIIKPKKDGSLPTQRELVSTNNKGTLVILIQEDNYFNPVRNMNSATNLLLQGIRRYEYKSFWGQTKSLMADFRSPVRRRTRNLSDAELKSRTRSAVVLTPLDTAIREELDKRTNTERVIHGQKTLIECVLKKLEIYAPIHKNKFSGKTVSELDKMLDEHEADKKLSGGGGGRYTSRNVAAIRRTLQMKKIKEVEIEQKLHFTQSTDTPIAARGVIEMIRTKFSTIKGEIRNLKNIYEFNNINHIVPEKTTNLEREINLFHFRLQLGFEKNSSKMIIAAVNASKSINEVLDKYKSEIPNGSEVHVSLEGIKEELEIMNRLICGTNASGLISKDTESGSLALHASYIEQGMNEDHASLLIGLGKRIEQNNNRVSEIQDGVRFCAIELGIDEEPKPTLESIQKSINTLLNDNRVTLEMLLVEAKKQAAIYIKSETKFPSDNPTEEDIRIFLGSVNDEDTIKHYLGSKNITEFNNRRENLHLNIVNNCNEIRAGLRDKTISNNDLIISPSNLIQTEQIILPEVIEETSSRLKKLTNLAAEHKVESERIAMLRSVKTMAFQLWEQKRNVLLTNAIREKNSEDMRSMLNRFFP